MRTRIFASIVSLSVAVLVIEYVKPGTSAAYSPFIHPGPMPDPRETRYSAAVDGAPSRGTETPKVTIIEYSDFECPYCRGVEPTLAAILKKYGRYVQVAWKNKPLNIHPHARDAAMLAFAAQEHGRFWDLHHKLFDHQDALDPVSLRKYGREVGLGDDEIDAALYSSKYNARLAAQLAEGDRLNVNGAPFFLINGRRQEGAAKIEIFSRIIDEELANADAALARGVPASGLYAELTRDAKEKYQYGPPPAEPHIDPAQIYQVPIGDSPVAGTATAKVTIVEFSDFQCPSCAKAEPTLAALRKRFGSDLRVVWKNHPLEIHEQAELAAEAALAAGDQGKFWEMHDLLFEHREELSSATMQRLAAGLGLDAERFRRALDTHQHQPQVRADEALAQKLAARATPIFFINGHPLVGAQAASAFEKVINKELARADAMLAKGIAPRRLYEMMTADGKAVAEVPAQAARPTRQNVPVGAAPTHGASNAPVTIIEYADFECPYCGQIEDALKKVAEHYGSTVRFAFKQYPLPFHEHAGLAAEAALAAQAQGRFWQMHDLMFAHQKQLDRASLERDAAEAGLDVARFRADLDRGKWKARVAAETAEGNKFQINGTPSFFVNGRSLFGFVPPQAFEQLIDAALQEAPGGAKRLQQVRSEQPASPPLPSTAPAPETAPAPSCGGPSACPRPSGG